MLQTGLESIHAAIVVRNLVVHPGIIGENVVHRQVMTLADLIVIEVVCRSNLDAAGTELRLNVVIGDNRNTAANDGQNQFLANKMLVTIIIRMNGNGAVTEHGFRSGCRNHQVAIAGCQWIAEMPKVAVFIGRQHFEIGQGRVQHRVPVDETLAPINQSFVVQLHEYLADSFGQTFVHRKTISTPVHGCAKATGLIGDLTAGFVFPGPDALDKFFTTKIVFRQAIVIQDSLHDHLCGNASVVHARLPECAMALHTMKTRQRIHDRVLEGVTHVQRSGHVRRRNDNAIGFTVALGLEVALFFPVLVQTLFDVLRLVGLIHQIL